MTTITRFTTEQLIKRLDEQMSSARYALGFVQDSEILRDIEMDLRLAEIARASLEAEAVGEVVLGEYDDCGCHPDARVVCIAADGQADWENFKDGTRLYAAPPSLVEIDEREAFNAWNNDENLPIAGVGAKNAAWLAWQARAAMLQGSQPVSNRDELLPSIKPAPELDFVAENAKSLPGNPPSKCSLRDGIEAIRNSGIPVDVDKIQSECEAGNSPVIPDCWIKCSDRMPEKGQKVFYYFDIVGVHAGYYDGDNTFVKENGGGWLTGDVTHWMDWILPAAPQQE